MIAPMRRLLIRFLIFGLLGPAGTYFGVYLTTRTAARWWWPLPSIYVVELVPFLCCALVDYLFKDVRAWERFVIAGIGAFVASALACAFAYGGLSAWVFGLYAPILAGACSLLATGADVEDATPIDDRNWRR
jgi:hypothetical protein